MLPQLWAGLPSQAYDRVFLDIQNPSTTIIDYMLTKPIFAGASLTFQALPSGTIVADTVFKLLVAHRAVHVASFGGEKDIASTIQAQAMQGRLQFGALNPNAIAPYSSDVYVRRADAPGQEEQRLLSAILGVFKSR